MKKILVFIVGLLLFALGGCADGGDSDEDLTLRIRGAYLASPMISTHCDLVADYGQRVYEFGYDIVKTNEKTVLTLTKPTELVGLTVSIDQKTSVASYEGISVETGALSDDGLTPVTGAAAVLQAVMDGFIRSTAVEDDVLHLICGEPDGTLGTGREVSLWMDAQTGEVRGGEITVDGVRKISCEFTNFSWGGLPQNEENTNGQNDDENVGRD